MLELDRTSYLKESKTLTELELEIQDLRQQIEINRYILRLNILEYALMIALFLYLIYNLIELCW